MKVWWKIGFKWVKMVEKCLKVVKKGEKKFKKW